MGALLEALAALEPVVEEALNKGVSSEALVGAIKALIVEASDAEMKREFPGEK